MSASPRPTCLTCLRPATVCYCRHVRPVTTTTRVVLLQHPRERDVAIGTARMASLCLPNSELHVGVRWRGSTALARALGDPARPPALLYPGPGAIDVLRHPPARPVTLVVVDGTWWQTKKVVRENPELAALPRYAFAPPSPSEYRIRREPQPSYVSTLEALVHVLGALEGDPERFRGLLEPFRAMIDAQLAYEALYRDRPSRHAKKPRPPPAPPHVPSVLRERPGDIVCVYGEANAWPYASAERAGGFTDELVHWVARRPSTGETLDVVLAPRHPASPATTLHSGLSAEVLAGGRAVEELEERWRAFARETDVVCSWGHYVTALFAGMGLPLSRERVDLRHAARVYARGKVGTLDEFVARVGLTPSPPAGQGRAHVRLAQIAAITGHFAPPV